MCRSVGRQADKLRAQAQPQRPQQGHPGEAGVAPILPRAILPHGASEGGHGGACVDPRHVRPWRCARVAVRLLVVCITNLKAIIVPRLIWRLKMDVWWPAVGRNVASHTPACRRNGCTRASLWAALCAVRWRRDDHRMGAESAAAAPSRGGGGGRLGGGCVARGHHAQQPQREAHGDEVRQQRIGGRLPHTAVVVG